MVEKEDFEFIALVMEVTAGQKSIVNFSLEQFKKFKFEEPKNQINSQMKGQAEVVVIFIFSLYIFQSFDPLHFQATEHIHLT